jgi:hypothetical protein
MPRSHGDNGCVSSLSKEVLSGASCGLDDTKWTMMQPHHASTALSGNRRCCSSNNSCGSSSANSHMCLPVHSSCCWGVPHQALHMCTWAMPTACCTVLLGACCDCTRSAHWPHGGCVQQQHIPCLRLRPQCCTCMRMDGRSPRYNGVSALGGGGGRRAQQCAAGRHLAGELLSHPPRCMCCRLCGKVMVCSMPPLRPSAAG